MRPTHFINLFLNEMIVVLKINTEMSQYPLDILLHIEMLALDITFFVLNIVLSATLFLVLECIFVIRISAI